MKRLDCGKTWLACAALLSGGCGAFPNFIVDAARSSAKEALEEAVGDAVDGVIDDSIGALLDSDGFEFPFVEGSEHVDDRDARAR